MSNEFVEKREAIEEEFSEEEIEEWDPEMQGFVQGWKQAYSEKKERAVDDFDEESY
tara:strand:+ start:776 stop:943 length:168 start_codon:yes stop_codon:yes gene_type:complete